MFWGCHRQFMCVWHLMSGNQKEVQLKEVFRGKHFTEKDISRVLNLSQSNAHYFRHKLLKQQKIARIARGKYKFTSSEQEFKHDSLTQYIQKSLSILNKKFVITGSSFFNRFYPLSNHIVIYVEKGSAQLFLGYLASLQLNFVALAEPKAEEIELLRTHAQKRNFIIIREKNYFYGSTEGIASLETAFVDYYFEITRKLLPIENKVEDVLDHLLANHTLNISTLLRYAKERGIRTEIKNLLEDVKMLHYTKQEKDKTTSDSTSLVSDNKQNTDSDFDPEQHNFPDKKPKSFRLIKINDGDNHE